jgi:hypothetical protein
MELLRSFVALTTLPMAEPSESEITGVTRADVIILKNMFSKKLSFMTQNKAKLAKIFITTLIFEEKAIFLQKILMIITSTQDEFVNKIAQNVAKPFLPKSMLIFYQSNIFGLLLWLKNCLPTLDTLKIVQTVAISYPLNLKLYFILQTHIFWESQGLVIFDYLIFVHLCMNFRISLAFARSRKR